MTEPQIIHILGIRQRCGTNYLCNLLLKHPDVAPNPKIAEDHLLNSYHHIENFFSGVTQKWSKGWDPNDQAKSDLRKEFGNAYKRFFLNNSDTHTATSVPAKCVITKTPSVNNLELFPLLPDSKAIVIVRDGRSVVESAMQTFRTSFRKETKSWAEAADLIHRCIEAGQQLHLVRYEDLFLNTETELRKIFTFMSLDGETYPYELAAKAPVIGSSKESKIKGKVSWKPIEKPENFNPLDRWQSWSLLRQLYFNMLAGKQMSYFGYQTSVLNFNIQPSLRLAKPLK